MDSESLFGAWIAKVEVNHIFIILKQKYKLDANYSFLDLKVKIRF